MEAQQEQPQTIDLGASKERLQNALFQLEDMVLKRLKEADDIAHKAANAGTIRELRELHADNLKLKSLYEQEKVKYGKILDVSRKVSGRLDILLDEVSNILDGKQI